MNAEIKRLILDIKTNTKIDFSLFSESGLILSGDEKQDFSIPSFSEAVFFDQENDCTYFKIIYQNKKYVGKIKGSDQNASAIAYLIASLFAKKPVQTTEYTKSIFIKELLNGETDDAETSKHIKNFKISTAPVCAMIIYSNAGRLNEVEEVLSSFLQDSADEIVSIDDKQCVLIKFMDESVKDYSSFDQYAEFLRRSIFEEYGIKVAIFVGGLCKYVSEIAKSYQQALAVQRLARIEEPGGIHSFKDYILEKIIEDLPKDKIVEYLDLLSSGGTSEIFFDPEMNGTVEEFLENNLNASETSRKLFLHRNTLSYRLDKTEKETGLDVRKFSDAIAYRVISILLKSKGKL